MATAEQPVATEDAGRPTLVRGLGTWDVALVTVGSTVGSAIFLAAGDVARAAPSAGPLLLLWVVGGLLTLAGALTYAELGAMFPRAGGMYHYLREAYGPLAAFLFGSEKSLIRFDVQWVNAAGDVLDEQVGLPVEPGGVNGILNPGTNARTYCRFSGKFSAKNVRASGDVSVGATTKLVVPAQ